MSWEGIGTAAVLGLGRQGESAARALLGKGVVVRLLDRLDDDAVRARAARLPGAEVGLGREDAADIEGADLIVASAPVPPGSAWVIAGQEQGTPIWSDIELAYRLGIRMVAAVTGTNGKTTTTDMITAILRAAGRPVRAAGNIGFPICDVAAGEEAVVETSSFQLHSIETFRTPISVLLNIGSDHLDWHGSATAYKKAKMRVFENQGPSDVAVVHADPECDAMSAGAAARLVRFHEAGRPIGGAGVEDDWIVVPEGRVMATADLRSPTRPFRADAVAAAAATCAMGVGTGVVATALASFAPKPHRIEQIAVVDGVTYINDSKATDPHATLAALEEMHDVILIAGGRNKGLDLGELAEMTWAIKAVVAIGEAAGEIVSAFEGTEIDVTRAASLEEAVETARGKATAGDTVLLSPACASQDMFIDYEHRGEVFRSAVTRLQGSRL